MSKANKNKFVEFVNTLIARYGCNCEKLAMQNIIFPCFNDNKMISLLFRQMIKTKEQPEGCLYDEDKYQVVLRVINGKLLMNGMLDAYTWKRSKVQNTVSVPIGCKTSEGLKNLYNFLGTVDNEDEKKIVLDLFNLFNIDFLLAHTDSENRICIEVTQELFDNGLTYSVDQWMEVDENGDAEITLLNVGDFLIITDEGAYCIRGEEFRQTHRFWL